MSAKQRPTGVTILAVLAAIGGVLGLLGSVVLLALVPLMGGLGLVSSVLSLAFAYGAWTLKPWGWTLGIVTEILSLATSALTVVTGFGDIGGQVISVAIALAILYYLFQPSIKAAFGKA